jgi:hypothetical protein
MKPIPKRLEFRFKKSEYGYEGKAYDYTIKAWRVLNHWCWDVERKGFGQIAESDKAKYKNPAPTYKAARWRALVAVHKYRQEHE